MLFSYYKIIFYPKPPPFYLEIKLSFGRTSSELNRMDLNITGVHTPRQKEKYVV